MENVTSSALIVGIAALLTRLPTGSQTGKRSDTLDAVLRALDRHTSLTAISVLLAVATCVPAYGGPNPVSATAAVSVPQLTAGQSAEVTITIEIADGWHINAADPGLAFLIPTSVSFDLPPGVRASGPRFPEPETRRLQIAGDRPLRLYQGTVRVGATVSYAEAASRGGEASATLKYQACNDTVCLRPATLTLPLALTFAGATGRVPDGVAPTATRQDALAAGCILAATDFYFPCGSRIGRTNVD